MQKSNHPKSLSEHFSIIVDPRVDRTKEHRLEDILMISLCGMLCGAESFVDFADFGRAKEEWLRTFLELPNGIPSHDTFTRVFAALDARQFSECFVNWTQSLRRSVAGEIVAIDGKTLRRSHNRFKDKGAIHMVSAWARENGLVLGQVKVDEKSNEITAIPELLRRLELSGCIVTIDAMGAQKSIATEIINADADYVLALKGNHEILHEEIATYFEDARERNFKGIAHDFLETTEKGHGRIEIRRFWITDSIDWIADKPLWEGLRSIAMIESTRIIGDKTSTERRFFLCSLPPQAERFARAARGHWAIENQLHWCLDVCFNEDQSRARSGSQAQNLATLRHLALNLLKSDSTKKRGIKGKQLNASWDHSFLLSLLKF